MTPVYSEKYGDCLAAAIASVLDLKLTDVPDVPSRIQEFYAEIRRRGIKTEAEFFPEYEKWLTETCEEYTRDLQRIWTEWFDARGLVCLSFKPPAPTKGYCIAGCEDGPHTHAMVMLNGEIIHDPEKPEYRRGQPWKVTSIHVIVPRDPSVLLTKKN